jgi:hypothetical protein
LEGFVLYLVMIRFPRRGLGHLNATAAAVIVQDCVLGHDCQTNDQRCGYIRGSLYDHLQTS